MSNNLNTLDSYHKKIVNSFDSKKDLIKLNKRLEKYQEEYEELVTVKDSECTIELIRRKKFLNKDIKRIKTDISNIENKKKESDYYLKTMDLLTTYFNKSEDKKSMTEDKKPSILDFLNNKNVEETNDLTSLVKREKKFSKKLLFNDYLTKVDENSVHIKVEYVKNYTFCDNCNTEKVLIQSEALYVCYTCGECNNTLIDADKPSYKEPITEVCSFSYKRYNHFAESKVLIIFIYKN